MPAKTIHKPKQRAPSVPVPQNPPVPAVSSDAPVAEAAVLASASDDSDLERNNKIILRIGSAMAAATVAVSVVIAAFSATQQTGQSSAPTPSPMAVPTAEASIPPFSRSAVSFEVYNGSGVAGAAAREGKRLERVGYRVVSLGNAPQQVEGNRLYLRQSVSSFSDAILADVSRHFGVTTVSGALIEGTASARLIVGK